MKLNFRIETQKVDDEFTERVRYVCFSSDRTRFCTCSDKGINIFEADTLKLLFSHLLKIFCISLGVDRFGYTPIDDRRTFRLFDIKKKKEFRSVTCQDYIVDTRLCSDFVLIIHPIRSNIHSIKKLECELSFKTYENKRAICAVNNDPNLSVIALPGKKEGSVLIHKEKKIVQDSNEEVEGEDDDDGVQFLSEDINIEAFDEVISSLALSRGGELLAVGGTKKGRIKIFQIDTQKFLKQLSTARSEIQSLSFSNTSDFFTCTSKDQILHLYSLNPKQKNPKSKSSFLGSKFRIEKSLTHLRGFKTPAICSFCWNDELARTILIVNQAKLVKVKFVEDKNKCLDKLEIESKTQFFVK